MVKRRFHLFLASKRPGKVRQSRTVAWDCWRPAGALREVMVEGQRLVMVLKLSVKQQYGIDSEKLSEFGLQPFRGRRRKVNEPPPVETVPVE